MSNFYTYDSMDNETDDFNNFPYYGGTTSTPEPYQEPPKRKPRRRLVKKLTSITLSAVLFGAVAAGSFQAVHSLSSSKTSTVQPASSGNQEGLLKTVSTASTGTSNTGSLDVTDIAANSMPSIVSITNKSVSEVQDYFQQYGYGRGNFSSGTQETESCGSGIIIGKNDTELLIVTNYHVIEDANSLSVCFVDNEVYESAVKGTDPSNDLAVIAVPLDDISEDTLSQIAVASIGNSDALKVGEQVVAIGNALGYGQSVTTGIVSAVNRSIDTETSENGTVSGDTASATYIQTDAAINPGNSGGALLNMDGEVIGINSAKLASTEVEGMGYAIPVSQVSDIIENLMSHTTRTAAADGEQGSLGISGSDISSDVQEVYGFPAGVYVSEVASGSAAEAAGIATGTIITAFDGESITSISQLKQLLSYYTAGETVDVTVQVMNGNTYEEQTVTVTLDTSTSDSTSPESGNTLQGYGQEDFFNQYFGY